MKAKNNKPHFSIIIPTLNEEGHLPFLLKDLEKQTYKDFEVIVVDANSKDKTKIKAEGFKEKIKTLKIIDSRKRNVCTQRNLGAKKALGEWLIFMDADNRIPNYFLQGIKFQLEFLKPDILTTWIEPDTKNYKDKAIATLTNLYIELQKTKEKPSVLESLLCIKKECFERIKGFNESIHWGEGSDLLERAIERKMRFEVVRTPTYQYSFRRLRKEGTLELFRKVAQLELSRLVDKDIAKEKRQILYPMEGGSYFAVSNENKKKLKKIFLEISKKISNSIKTN